MSAPIISVRGLGKRYQMGATLRHDTLRDQITHAARALGRRFRGDAAAGKSKSSSFWALKDVSFDVQPGEVVGVIGRNGAGKSTLLKILSQITEPTEGEVRIRGRLASLLEVGTGFHQELTGRENIFLNGVILGMTQAEIRKKFDEIVAFAEVDKFLDTPVKRYSSGMYVRLAFAVAAHLEPEILVVDEVLAVGDAEFQKKCLGKMQDVAEREGRTVLFVSHNMTAVRTLCRQGILLREGRVAAAGKLETVIDAYLRRDAVDSLEQHWDDPASAPGNEYVRVKSVCLVPVRGAPDDPIDVRTPLTVRFAFWNLRERLNLNLSLHLYSLTGGCVFNVGSPVVSAGPGLLTGECQIPGNLLNDGPYMISMMIVKDASACLFNLPNAVTFEVADFRENTAWYGKWPGAVRPQGIPFTLTATAEGA